MKLWYGSIDEESSSLTPSKLEEEQKTSLIKLDHAKIKLNFSFDTILRTSFWER
ncbi:hypothetical protein F2Q68_00005679 [Brassica cretica]|uniref:Uncharacterized protein n=1 Tax=Brassica cretica TaxID=69181 RepID=A0A8S9JJG0_BRACR|nr:hypothetical protein F2Q68_00005679 [Brassica cretica]